MLAETLRADDEARRDFRWKIGECMLCGARSLHHDIHEISRGAGRGKAVKDRRCWLLLCRRCHELCGDYAVWPLAKQYALKAIADPDWYDRVAVNEMRGRMPEAMPEVEVVRAAYQLGKEDRYGGVNHGTAGGEGDSEDI